MSEKYHCKKCDKPARRCLCHLDDYIEIGDIGACKFLDEQISYKEDAGSEFFQGWAYKHNQMKFKLNEKDLEIAELDKFVSELVEYINNVGGCSCESGLKCCRCKILRRIEIKSDAWKKKFKA